MTPARWQVVKEMLAAVLALPRNERAAYLKGVSRNDPTLGAELKDLVAAEEAGGDLLEPPTISIASEYDAETVRRRASRRIGPYQIVGQIGLGGMGEVYRAFRADDEYGRRVAIKLIRAGADSHFVVERFKTERQLLASFDHPNIARLFDGGTTDDGVPYFVMELIEGLPITEYCDRHKLPVADRLRLFRQTCSAVQYAHQRLIIHRDLKPSNILVTAEGVPKLLDFGIAKVVDPGGADGLETTRSTFRILTPEYASPEQVKGDGITTASDVYSLGILLCELLTGCRPYRIAGRAPHELAQAICDFEPKKPSALALHAGNKDDDSAAFPESVSAARASTPEKLSKLLRGDVDNIVLMALRKEPWRRYASAAQLASDVQRHLDGLPVAATNDTLGYRVSKFVARHKAGVVAASVLALTLFSAGVVTFHEARTARRERAIADERFKDMRELARSNLFEFSDAIQNLPGSSAARHLVIQRALGYLDKLSKDAARDRDLEQELAAGYEKIAALQGNFGGPGIGDSNAAVASYQKALAIRAALSASSNNNVDQLKAEIATLRGYTRSLILTGRVDNAVKAAEQGLSLADAVAAKQPRDSGAAIEQARTHTMLALTLGGNGSSGSPREIPAAIDHDRKAIEILTQPEFRSGNKAARRALVQAKMALASHLTKARRFDESLRIYREVLPAVEEFPRSDSIHRDLHEMQAVAFDHAGDLRNSIEERKNVLALIHPVVQADPQNLVAQIQVAIDQGSIGVELARLGDATAGKHLMDGAVKVGERLLKANPAEVFYKDLLRIGYGCQGEILSLMGDQPGAYRKYSQALTTAADVERENPSDLDAVLSVAKIRVASGVVLARGRRFPEARTEFNTALDGLGTLLRLRPQDEEALYVLQMTRANIAELDNCSKATGCTDPSKFRLPNLDN